MLITPRLWINTAFTYDGRAESTCFRLYLSLSFYVSYRTIHLLFTYFDVGGRETVCCFLIFDIAAELPEPGIDGGVRGILGSYEPLLIVVLHCRECLILIRRHVSIRIIS